MQTIKSDQCTARGCCNITLLYHDIKMGVTEIACELIDWTGSSYRSLSTGQKHLRIPQKRESCTTISLLRWTPHLELVEEGFNSHRILCAFSWRRHLLAVWLRTAACGRSCAQSCGELLRTVFIASFRTGTLHHFVEHVWKYRRRSSSVRHPDTGRTVATD